VFLLPIINTQKYLNIILSSFLITGGIKNNPRPNKPRTTNKGSNNTKFLIVPIIKVRIKIQKNTLIRTTQEGSGLEVSDSSALPQFLQTNAS
jgi:hypothetical protein